MYHIGFFTWNSGGNKEKMKSKKAKPKEMLQMLQHLERGMREKRRMLGHGFPKDWMKE